MALDKHYSSGFSVSYSGAMKDGVAEIARSVVLTNGQTFIFDPYFDSFEFLGDDPGDRATVIIGSNSFIVANINGRLVWEWRRGQIHLLHLE